MEEKKTGRVLVPSSPVRKSSSRLKGGIYHRTQIDMTYNSNHMEGSRLTLNYFNIIQRLI